MTALNADRRQLNAMIHDARKASGELGEKEAIVPVLTPANIRDGELRRMDTWETHGGSMVLLDNTYYKIDALDKDAHLVTLKDAQGKTRSLSPAQAATEGVTLYRPDTIAVSPGDRMRFSKSDNERGFVANSVWTVSDIKGDSVTLTNGKQTRTVTGRDDAAPRLRRVHDCTVYHAHGAGVLPCPDGAGAQCRRRGCHGHRGSYHPGYGSDGAEPDLQSGPEVLAARILSAVLCGASCRAGHDCDVIRGITGNTGV